MSNSTASKLQALPGLDTAKKVVLRLATAHAGTHAVLFYGLRGAGKKTLAHVLAQAWLCKDPSLDGACGQCSACQRMERGSNTDLLVIRPGGDGDLIPLKAIIEDTSWKHGEAPPLQLFFRTGPLDSRHKVAIILDCHRFGDRAENAILKTVEEPHPHARLIFVTSQLRSVIPTVRSRCLCIACEVGSPGSSSDVTHSEAAVTLGAPMAVRELRDHPVLFESLDNFAHSLPLRHAGEALKVAEDWMALSDSLAKALELPTRPGNALAMEMLASRASRIKGVDPRWIQLMAETHRRILQNGNMGILCDALFTRMLRHVTPPTTAS